MKRERALDADAVRNLAHGERFADAAAAPLDDDALKHLDPLAGPFHDLYIYPQLVARTKARNVLAKLLLRQFLNQRMHRYPSFRLSLPANRKRNKGYCNTTFAEKQLLASLQSPGGISRRPEARSSEKAFRSPASQRRSSGVRSAFSSKSGRLLSVRSSDCRRRHSAISAWWPDNRMSGTFHPRKSAGRVYCGYSSRPSLNESRAADSSFPSTPGRSLTTASMTTIAGNSPPVST